VSQVPIELVEEYIDRPSYAIWTVEAGQGERAGRGCQLTEATRGKRPPSDKMFPARPKLEPLTRRRGLSSVVATASPPVEENGSQVV
jgi:hypothetical protein